MRNEPPKAPQKDAGSDNQSAGKRDWSRFNGIAFLAAVLRSVDPAFRAKLHAKLKQVAPLAAAVVESFEFVYEDLARVETKSLAKVWGAVAEKDMLLAWKLTSEPLREHLLKGLSDRRRQDFVKAFEALPRVPKIQVVRVQWRVAAAIHKLAREGKLALTFRHYEEERTQKKRSSSKVKKRRPN